MCVVVLSILRAIKIQSPVVREFIGEFLGTFILVLLGNASFAQDLLDGNKLDSVFAIVFAWGAAVMLGIAACGNVSGGHINPAVTVALAATGKFPWKKVVHYIIAQYLGAFVASAVLYLNYWDLLNNYDPDRTVTGETATAFIWATYPKPQVSIWNCVFDQVICTAVLMFTILAFIDESNMNFPKWSLPLAVGTSVSVLALCFSNCMAPMNPARDFAPRCFTALAGYGIEVFTHRNYWWVPIIAPHVGAIVGGWVYFFGIELHFPDNKIQKPEITDELLTSGGTTEDSLDKSREL